MGCSTCGQKYPGAMQRRKLVSKVAEVKKSSAVPATLIPQIKVADNSTNMTPVVQPQPLQSDTVPDPSPPNNSGNFGTVASINPEETPL